VPRSGRLGVALRTRCKYFDGENPGVCHQAIRTALAPLTNASGVMETKVNFYAADGDIAVPCADYLVRHEGTVIIAGTRSRWRDVSPDGTWLYILDHATGASLPSAADDKTN
jgi:hypothetical protein